MRSYNSALVDFILRFKVWIALIIIVITILLGFYASSIKINNELNIWFSHDDEIYTNYDDFRGHFGEDKSIIIIYRNDSLFSNYQLSENRNLTKKLQEIKGVKDVISLTSLIIPKITPFQVVYAKAIPRDAKDQNVLKEKICNLPILIDNLVSEDGKASAYQVFINDTASKKDIFIEVKRIISEMPEHENYLMAGGIPMEEEITRLSSEEPVIYLMVTIVIMILILYFIFRSYFSPIIPIFIALISITWTMGLLSLAGGSVNMIVAIIPLVLLVVNVAFSIHLISNFNRNIKENLSIIDSIKKTVNDVLIPGTIASVTTSLAFLAFAFSTIIPIRIFGIFAAAGVIISYVLTLFLLPILFSLFNKWFGNEPYSNQIDKKRFAEKLVNFVSHNRKIILVSALTIFLISILGIWKLKFETDQIKYFKKSNSVRIANDTACEWFKGVYPFELVFDISNIPDDSIYIYLNKFKILKNRLIQIKDVEICHSATGLIEDIVKWNNSSVSEEAVLKRIIKSDRKENQSGMLAMFLSSDGNRYRIIVKTRWLDNQKAIELIPKIENEVNTVLGENKIPYYITGAAILYAHLNVKLLNAQIVSLSFSFLIIFIILILVFRKPSYFIAGILPNILPVLTTLGIMGYFKIPMDVGTVLIASISLGIAVDDTVYVLSAYKNYIKENSTAEALKLSYNKVWKAITMTTVVLVAGFFVLVFSNYIPVIYLGIFVSLNLIFALAYDYLLLPALLLTFNKRLISNK